MNRPEHMMRRALQEARKAAGRTRPNPMVGCVIARGSEVIAVGHHRRAGAAHAERVALDRAGGRAQGADLYVTLEPCDHLGRTGPCTEALIRAGVGRVIVGTVDPNPLVNGRGVRRLRAAGIPVEVGVLAEQCRGLNRAYEMRIVHHRPLVVAKVAQSLDGRVATRTGQSQWITGPRARDFGHRLRNDLDAILVGRQTVAVDDPQLTCRRCKGRDPIRVVLDSQARTSVRARIVQLAKTSAAPTWIVVGSRASVQKRRALEQHGVETIGCPSRAGRIDLAALLATLSERELMSVLVEGGPTVLGSFLDAGLVDQLHVLVAPLVIGGVDAVSAVGARGVAQLADAWRLQNVTIGRLGPDLRISGELGRPRTKRKHK